MSEESERAFLTSRFNAGGIALPTKMPNRPFAIPQDAPYGELWIMGGDPIDVGSEGEGFRRVRYVSILQFNVFIPEGMGTKASTEAGDKFKTMFQLKQGRDTDGAFYRFKLMGRTNPSTTQQGWSAMVYRVPFTRDEVVPVEYGISL